MRTIARKGNSQSMYCGEKTLAVSRKIATVAKQSSKRRGRPLFHSRIVTVPAITRNTTSDSTLTTRTYPCVHHPSMTALPCRWRKIMNQDVSGFGNRWAWKLQKYPHAEWDSTHRIALGTS